MRRCEKSQRKTKLWGCERGGELCPWMFVCDGMMNFTSGLVVCRSDFRRAVTWRTLARCWLMWSGSDWAGHVCETNGWLWVVDRSLPLKPDSDSGIGVQTVLRHVSIVRWMWRCLRIHSFDRFVIINMCPCSGLRPKKSSQRLGGLKSLRTQNLSWSVCFNLCKMGLPHWACYNVGLLCSHPHLIFLQHFRLLQL